MSARNWLERRLIAFLTGPVARYELHGWNDLAALKRSIRKGDILLSQGNQRVSAIIRYLTQSPWSHAMLYIGDELLVHGGERAQRAREAFGEGAEHLLIDAVPQGVIAAPLSRYVDYNIRLCRPRLAPEDCKTVLEDAIAAIGWRYDLRNLVDLARYYLPAELVPQRLRRQGPRLGSGARATVICTSLIGALFDRVGYPIHPIRDGRRRHPSLLAPCDFDRSPYFEIVKFNAGDESFDYRSIAWNDEPFLSDLEP